MPNTPLFELLLLAVIVATITFVVWYSTKQKESQSQDNAYVEAMEYMTEGNDRLAIQKFKDAVRDDSENISAYLRLGDLLRKKGMLGNAVRIHQDLTLRGNLSLENHLRILKSLLMDYTVSGNLKDGIPTARKILQKDNNPEGWVVQKLAEMLEKEQNWKEAEDIANKYSHLLPSNYQPRVALYLVFQGLRLHENGNGKEARVKFKEALKKDSRCAAAYYYLGMSYREEARLDDAIKFWKRLCNESPDSAYIAYPELEKAWFELGRFADAENMYLEQLNKPGKSLKAALALAEIYTKKGEYDNALEILNRMDEEHLASPQLIRKKVSVLYNKGQYKQAVTQSLAFFDTYEGIGDSEYVCKVCNTKSETPVWICQQCQSLDSYNI